MKGGLTIEQMEFLVGKGLSAEEMVAFAKMGGTRSKAAERTARWRARKNGNVTSDVTCNGHSDASPPPIEDHTPPVSSNDETRPAPKAKRKSVVPKPDGVSDGVWRDFNRQRKTAVTETAVEGIALEAKKAGWSLNAALTEAVSRGWQSFKAEWVADSRPANDGPANCGSLVDLVLARQASGP